MFRPLCIIEFEIAFILKKKFERARAPLELKLKLKLKLYRSARKFVIYIAIKKGSNIVWLKFQIWSMHGKHD